MGKRLSIAGVIGLFLMAMSLVGCAGMQEQISPTGTGPSANTDPSSGPAALKIVTYEPVSDACNAAAFIGVLEQRDGCLVVKGEDGTVTVPLWPKPALGQITTDSIEFAGATFSLGDSVTLGGSGNSGTPPTGGPALTGVLSCLDAGDSHWWQCPSFDINPWPNS